MDGRWVDLPHRSWEKSQPWVCEGNAWLTELLCASRVQAWSGQSIISLRDRDARTSPRHTAFPGRGQRVHWEQGTNARRPRSAFDRSPRWWDHSSRSRHSARTALRAASAQVRAPRAGSPPTYRSSSSCRRHLHVKRERGRGSQGPWVLTSAEDDDAGLPRALGRHGRGFRPSLASRSG